MKKTIMTLLSMLFLVSVVFAISSIQRQHPSQVERCSEVDIDMVVDVDDASFYAIDETIPEGWILVDEDSAEISEDGHLKWLDINDAEDTTYTYTLRAPCYSFGEHEFQGIYMFEGDDSNKNLETSIEIIPEDCDDKKCLGEDPFEGMPPPAEQI